MRGVVSLAAGLSIPVYLANGQEFPHRNLVLFITFIVILLTLVVQGLTLPLLIRTFNIPDQDHFAPEEEDFQALQIRLMQQSLLYLQSNFATELQTQVFLQQMAKKWKSSVVVPEEQPFNEQSRQVYLQILEQQRNWLREWNKDPTVNEEVVRKHLLRLDLEEEKLHYS